jgi:hypothetical protein
MNSPSTLAHCVKLFGLSDVGLTIILSKHEIPSHQSAIGTGQELDRTPVPTLFDEVIWLGIGEIIPDKSASVY